MKQKLVCKDFYNERFSESVAKNKLPKKLVSIVRILSRIGAKLSTFASTESPSFIFSKVFSSLPFESQDEIDKIPTQTTRREREFLFNFFANQWSGTGDVVEVGPFLGGTTRMIALGMISNPRFGNDSLHTFDKFDGYLTSPKTSVPRSID